MNRIDTDDLSWSEKVMLFKALCKKRKFWCNNCPNCTHFEMKEPKEKEFEDDLILDFLRILKKVQKHGN